MHIKGLSISHTVASNSVHLQLQLLPPSYNAAYITTRGGGRALSEEGAAYKTETISELQRNYPMLLSFWQPDVPYFLIATMLFDHNQIFTSTKKAKNRYKKLDADNRLKLFLDALSIATGVDDSQYMGFGIIKEVIRPGDTARVLVSVFRLE